MKPTRHALERWAERFPGQDMALAYCRARCRVGKGTRKQIRERCPGHNDLMRGGFKGVFYAMTPERIVFVMAPPDTVITVFQLARRTLAHQEQA